MDFSASQYTQLIVALLGGVILFVLAYVASEKSVLTILVGSLPFQPIVSVYGTVNTVLIYMVAAVWMLRGRVKHTPLLAISVAIIFASLISLSQAPRPTYMDHFYYLIGIGANFLIFYIVYNYFRRPENDPRSALILFTIVGTLVAAFSVAKLLVGFDSVSVFGIQEFSLGENLATKKRLMGPFDAAGVNGAFYGLQILLCVFFVLHTKRLMSRIFLFGLILTNAGLLVATGSRGSFVVTIFGFGLFMLVFIRQIGVGRAFALSGAAAFMATLGAVLIVQFTDFNVLFERLGETEITGFVPDTRKGSFDLAFERIPDKLMFGHGPRLRLIDEGNRRIANHEVMFYPHNLYLHLLYTLGILGLLAYGTFFLALLLQFIRASRRRISDSFLAGMPRLGVVVLVVFLVDELKIEFLRFALFDYQSYMFALFGTLLAFTAKVAKAPSSVTIVQQRAAARMRK